MLPYRRSPIARSTDPHGLPRITTPRFRRRDTPRPNGPAPGPRSRRRCRAASWRCPRMGSPAALLRPGSSDCRAGLLEPASRRVHGAVRQRQPDLTASPCPGLLGAPVVDELSGSVVVLQRLRRKRSRGVGDRVAGGRVASSLPRLEGDERRCLLYRSAGGAGQSPLDRDRAASSQHHPARPAWDRRCARARTHRCRRRNDHATPRAGIPPPPTPATAPPTARRAAAAA
jgi:hypothetical protein